VFQVGLGIDTVQLCRLDKRVELRSAGTTGFAVEEPPMRRLWNFFHNRNPQRSRELTRLCS
jgi:hypothetical protein